MEHSFIILAFNESRFLQDCITSLEEQTVKSELLLSTSTPSTFLKEYSHRHGIPLVVNTVRRDLAADWTFAYQVCRTRYLTLTHQDDVYLPDYTSAFLSYMRCYKDALIGYSDYSELRRSSLRTRNTNLVIKRILLLPHLCRPGLRTRFCKKCMLSLGSPICRPSVMYSKERIGDFAFDSAFQINPDWDAWFRLAERDGTFVYINKRLVAHRIYQESETSKGIRDNRRQFEDEVLFGKTWPRYTAKVLAKLYSLSYRSNTEGAA